MTTAEAMEVLREADLKPLPGKHRSNRLRSGRSVGFNAPYEVSVYAINVVWAETLARAIATLSQSEGEVCPR